MPNEPAHHSPVADERTVPPDLARYSRQILFESIGVEGQRKLGEADVLLVGCGALGTVLGSTLVRAGVGRLRLCDRDFIDLTNLQRQALFDEDDIAANLPKAEAAARKLRRMNSAVTVEPMVMDVNHSNIERIADGAGLLLDGTDNFETRFLINDLAVKTRRPWVYGAVVGSTGLCLPIIPFETPCLRCIFENAPPPELSPTCDTAGVLAPVVNVIASMQAMEAIKLLTGKVSEVSRKLLSVDVWTGHFASLNVSASREAGDCPCCKHGRFDFLSGEVTGSATTLCGRDAVQINVRSGRTVDFAIIAARLGPVAEAPVTFNRFLLRTRVDGLELTLFADGRTIIRGTRDPDRAKSIHAKYIGA